MLGCCSLRLAKGWEQVSQLLPPFIKSRQREQRIRQPAVSWGELSYAEPYRYSARGKRGVKISLTIRQLYQPGQPGLRQAD